MITLENLKKIVSPIHLNNITMERFQGRWDNVQWMFNIYKNSQFKKGKNLVSLSYFLLREIDDVYSFARGKKLEEYKKEHAQKIQTYNKGLKTIINTCSKSNLDITVRIYCDITTIDLLQDFLRFPNVELFYYFIPKLFEGETMSHYGFLGTLLRYLPLFKTDFHNSGEWETVSINDIDTVYITEFTLINYYIKTPKLPNILYLNRACYYVAPRILHQNTLIPELSVISSFIIQREPQDFAVFLDFLSNCIIRECEKYKKLLNKYLPFDLKEKPFGGRLEYGVDEYFMNVFFIRRCYLDKNLPIAEGFNRDNTFGIVNWLFILTNEKDLKINNPKLLSEFLHLIVDLFFPKDYSFPKTENLPEIINIIGNDFWNMRINKKEFSLETYRKIVDFIKKYGPEELNIDPRIMPCFERSLTRHINSLVIKVVKPDPTYPKYTEKTYEIIRYKNPRKN